jgi:hypothetical protein
MRKIILAVLLGGAGISAYSQESENTERSVEGWYFGIQGNQLVRQIFNFSNSSTPVNNPYLLIFSTTAANGTGGNFSIGYNYNEANTGDAITSRVVTNSDFNVRAGIEKKSFLGKNFLLAFGVDLLYQSISTESRVQDNFGGAFTTVNKTSGFGFGPRLGISYHVTDNFLIGTEANYYVKFMKEKFSVMPGTSDQEDVKQLQLNVPTAIFLVLKF